jgi:hypothetical protein
MSVLRTLADRMSALLFSKQKGESSNPRRFTFTFLLLPFLYAGAGLLPVIGGRIGFSGRAFGSFTGG